MYDLAMDPIQRLKNDYPWIHTPLIVSAPMRLITLAESASEVSKAGIIFPSSKVATSDQVACL